MGSKQCQVAAREVGDCKLLQLSPDLDPLLTVGDATTAFGYGTE
mgnify:CR=1 FL=1